MRTDNTRAASTALGIQKNELPFLLHTLHIFSSFLSTFFLSRASSPELGKLLTVGSEFHKAARADGWSVWMTQPK